MYHHIHFCRRILFLGPLLPLHFRCHILFLGPLLLLPLPPYLVSRITFAVMNAMYTVQYERFFSVKRQSWAIIPMLLNSLPFSMFTVLPQMIGKRFKTRKATICLICLRMHGEFVDIEDDNMFEHVGPGYRQVFGSALASEMMQVDSEFWWS
ncbi:hypothetical protein BDP27DRAFT_425784 [Rhodocollybia butyracea]|uniref:Uncharacterized protein n=1 Tax=Rhodocollybia butyracea TaxID=206335 RepID=A0A9P5PZJ6_9AGAR|nr:hypothetical protein BDP27DRAFT_425784 [Rhodocollybia butyracea]